MRRALFTVADIAEAFGVSRWTASRILDEYDVPMLTVRGRKYVALSEIREKAPRLAEAIDDAIERSKP